MTILRPLKVDCDFAIPRKFTLHSSPFSKRAKSLKNNRQKEIPELYLCNFFYESDLQILQLATWNVASRHC